MKRLFVFAPIAFLFGLGAARDLAAQDLVITNARIIIGNGQVINQGSIVVRAGRIVSASPSTANAQGARAIDAKGMTLMPGFIDAHRHIMGGDDEKWFRQQSVPRMQEFLETGYTTLMSGLVSWCTRSARRP